MVDVQSVETKEVVTFLLKNENILMCPDSRGRAGEREGLDRRREGLNDFRQGERVCTVQCSGEKKERRAVFSFSKESDDMMMG